MKRLKAKEGYVFTQKADVKDEERWFASEMCGANINEENIKQVPIAEKLKAEKELEKQLDR